MPPLVSVQALGLSGATEPLAPADPTVGDSSASYSSWEKR